MTRDQLIDYLGMQLSLIPPRAHRFARPSGFFAGRAPAGLSGLRLRTSDGDFFYLAVLESGDFERPPELPPKKGGA